MSTYVVRSTAAQRRGRPSIPLSDGFITEVTRPTALNTGSRIPRGNLTPYSGEYIVTTPGVVVSGLLVTGRIVIRAANVTVEDCIVETGQTYTAGSPNIVDTSHSSARFSTIRFVEVSAANFPNVYVNGIGPKSYTAERCNVHDVVDAFSCYDLSGNNDNVTVKNNYPHDLFYITPDPNHSDNRTHSDIIQSQGGPTLVTIQGNNLQAFDSPNSTNGGSATGRALSCTMLNTEATRTRSNVNILGNWMGGGGYAVNGIGTDGGTVQIKRNKFADDHDFGPIAANETDSTVWQIPTSGVDANVHEGSGLPVATTATYTTGGKTIRRYY